MVTTAEEFKWSPARGRCARPREAAAALRQRPSTIRVGPQFVRLDRRSPGELIEALSGVLATLGNWGGLAASQHHFRRRLRDRRALRRWQILPAQKQVGQRPPRSAGRGRLASGCAAQRRCVPARCRRRTRDRAILSARSMCSGSLTSTTGPMPPACTSGRAVTQVLKRAGAGLLEYLGRQPARSRCRPAAALSSTAGRHAAGQDDLAHLAAPVQVEGVVEPGAEHRRWLAAGLGRAEHDRRADPPSISARLADRRGGPRARPAR